ncbi:MAG: adenylate/guanylate cyclase domain-containing protein [Candidatus Peregrinibacteria bacterium]
MLSRFLKNRALSGALIGVLVTIVLTLGISANLFESLNNGFTDSLYTLNAPSDDIVVIAIDDKSTQPFPEGLGRFSQWSRDKYVELLEILKKENPKVIAFDLVFHTPTEAVPREKLLELEAEIAKKNDEEKVKTYDEFLQKYKSSLDNPIDDEFSAELQKFDNIILAASITDDILIEPLLKFSLFTDLGIINTYLDRTGILRESIPYFHIESGIKDYDDFGVSVVKKYLEKDQLDLPLEDDKMFVNFFGDPYSYKMISFVDVINKQFDPSYFTNKIVLIGVTSAKELHDEYYTPRSNETPMPGVEFRANEIQTILSGDFLHDQSLFGRILTVAGISIVLTILLNFLGIALSIVVSAVVVGGYLLAAHILYGKGLIVNMVYPFAAIVLAYLASWVYKYFVADKKKREISSAFSHYVSDKLAAEISKNPDMVKLGGEKKTVTVFFSDIKNSTAISEKTEITSWVSQINEYFTAMESIIQAFDGTIDKYEGDAIMGFWNAPVSQEDHIIRAYMAALEMKKGIGVLHQKWQSEGKPLIEFRIGINTGEAIVGNFGSKNRFDYTVMGDTVNTASRLESSANKTYGTSIIVAGFEKLVGGAGAMAQVVMREIDTVLLPGKSAPVTLYELVCLQKDLTPEIQNLLTTYAGGLAAYRQKNWQVAMAAFSSLAADPPSQIMLERCRALASGQVLPQIDETMIFRIVNK